MRALVAELKTKENDSNVSNFINAIDDREMRADCKAIAKMMREATGKRARMWGTSIVGFDKYDYKYESGHSGSAAITGFSPRPSAIMTRVLLL